MVAEVIINALQSSNAEIDKKYKVLGFALISPSNGRNPQILCPNPSLQETGFFSKTRFLTAIAQSPLVRVGQIKHNLEVNVRYFPTQELEMPVCIRTVAEAGDNCPLLGRE